jgi:3'-phosphoadenosine 5'-phosphosulfate sulfotransferase (PAPS reductase)/FAD synthetase
VAVSPRSKWNESPEAESAGEALFTAADCWTGDPTDPGDDAPTPPEIVANLSEQDRRRRISKLEEQAHRIIDAALETHLDGHKLVGTCVLFSGGNDSTVLAHLVRSRCTHAVHCNTGIGVEATRQFVRKVCDDWGLPLLERHPPKGCTYRELCLDQGFPGPGHHFKMYQRLKQRALEQVQRELVSQPRRERLLFVAGRRRTESRRRAGTAPKADRTAGGQIFVPLHERKGSAIWASPIALWTKLDLVAYRGLHPDVPFNPVTDHLGMSGECLCGCYAQEGELERIRFWYPEVVAEIEALQVEVAAAGWAEPRCRWGHRSGGPPPARTGMLCTSCQFDDDGTLW